MKEGWASACFIGANISLALGKLLPLQGDRRATTVTQGDCPGLGGAALSGRIGEGGDALSGRMDEGGLGFCH